MMMLRLKTVGFLQGPKGKEGLPGRPGSEGLKVSVHSKTYVFQYLHFNERVHLLLSQAAMMDK